MSTQIHGNWFLEFCVYCGVVLKPTGERFRYCSEACRDSDGRTRRIEVTPTRNLQTIHRESKKARILERLRKGPATSAELCKITPAYSQRMGDLKKDGCAIVRADHCDRDGEFSSYTLIAERL